MRIRCPSCSATYDVSDALVSPPRTVRCAKCAHDWIATPIEDEAEVEAEPEEAAAPAAAPVTEPEVDRPRRSWEPVVDRSPDPVHEIGVVQLGKQSGTAIDRLNAPADLSAGARRRDRRLTAAWAASFAALAIFGVAAYTEREMLMRQWPASKRVYATLGLVPPHMNGPSARPQADQRTR